MRACTGSLICSCAALATVSLGGCYLTHERGGAGAPAAEDPFVDEDRTAGQGAVAGGEPRDSDEATPSAHDGGSVLSVLDMDDGTRPQVEPRTAPQIASGIAHRCVLMPDQNVYCWGENALGQLGRAPDLAGPMSPALVAGLPPIRQVVAGSSHTCVLGWDDSVYCWGTNDKGELGVGLDAAPDGCGGSPPDTPLQRDPTNCSKRPVRVSGLSDVVQVAAGTSRTCVRKGNGDVLCWGWLAPLVTRGYAENGVEGTPHPLPGIGPALDLATAPDHDTGPTCAVREGGDLQCWVHVSLPSSTFVPLSDPLADRGAEWSGFAFPAAAVQVSVGFRHVCAVGDDGSIHCQGDEDYREPAARVDGSLAAVIEGIGPALHVAVGRSETCALLEDHGVHCWGEFGSYRVEGVEDALELTPGCAGLADGRLLCWSGRGPATEPPELAAIRRESGAGISRAN